MPLLTLALAVALAVAPQALPANRAAEQDEQPSEMDRAFEAASARQYRAMRDSLGKSVTPLDWALAAGLWRPEQPDAARDKLRGSLLRKAADAAPNDALVQWLWAKADANVSGCDAQHPCPLRAAAAARLNPDNAANWIMVVNEADRAGDSAAVDAALSQMARGRYFNDMFEEHVMALADVYARHPLPAELERMAANQAAGRELPESSDPSYQLRLNWAFALGAGFGPAPFFVQACGRERNPHATAARFDSCRTIGRLMARSGNSMMSRRLGMAMLRTSKSATAEDMEVGRKLDWLQQQWIRQSKDHLSDQRKLVAYFTDLETTRSEMAAVELQLQRAGVAVDPPAEWQQPTLQ